MEGIAISIVLPVWKNDVPTIIHAIRLRKEEEILNSPLDTDATRRST